MASSMISWTGRPVCSATRLQWGLFRSRFALTAIYIGNFHPDLSATSLNGGDPSRERTALNMLDAYAQRGHSPETGRRVQCPSFPESQGRDHHTGATTFHDHRRQRDRPPHRLPNSKSSLIHWPVPTRDRQYSLFKGYRLNRCRYRPPVRAHR